MGTALSTTRRRARSTVCVIQSVFVWWVTVPAMWLRVLAALIQDGVKWPTAIPAAAAWSLPIGLGLSLIVHLLGLGLLRLIGDEPEPCLRCGSTRTRANYCGHCGRKLATTAVPGPSASTYQPSVPPTAVRPAR